MNLVIENRDGITIVEIKERRLLSEVTSKLKAKLLIEAQPDINALLIDISQVETIDSSGFGAFLLAQRQLREHNIPVFIVGASPSIYNMFEILSLVDTFSFAETIDDAIKAIKTT
ncbi:MAG: STAS domain-containing protein [Ignavibacteria bacterium]|nr:STAS domain-containing protein [Ignavibacteria bacterium]